MILNYYSNEFHCELSNNSKLLLSIPPQGKHIKSIKVRETITLGTVFFIFIQISVYNQAVILNNILYSYMV